MRERSGLLEAIDILQGVNGLAFVHFDESDVVRHHLVQRIIRAYDEHKVRVAEQQLSLLETRPGTGDSAASKIAGAARVRASEENAIVSPATPGPASGISAEEPRARN